MKLIIADVREGRSCVVHQVEWTHNPKASDVDATSVADIAVSEPTARAVGVSEYRDYGVPVGTARWNRVRFPANQVRPLHYTNTIDTHTIVEGSLWLVLDDGEHELLPGDSAIVNGVDHGWHIGPAGCVVSSVLFGLPGR
ncbi:hypothetical protein ABCS02_17310 [Microbacterium sp. X-17]|uniref:hypothetical protein n=1 Tax=Microbacterium sp. X-17 TaxID=3144404 RepID=UPI0031F50852